jgi:hypothetical protein
MAWTFTGSIISGTEPWHLEFWINEELPGDGEHSALAKAAVDWFARVPESGNTQAPLLFTIIELLLQANRKQISENHEYPEK